MHYRNGREAKNGDKVVQLGFNAGSIVAFGVLFDAVPGNDYCNGSIAPAQYALSMACLCDCLHVDDLAELLAEKGLDKRPEAKPAAVDEGRASAEESTGAQPQDEAEGGQVPA
jgi:hypothetical protein